MGKKKISFDLHRSNKIFKANFISLLTVSTDSISDQDRQYKKFLKEISQSNAEVDWLEKSSHFANIDWLLFNSMFLSAFSLFEHHLFVLARVVERKTSSKIQIDDFSGKGIIKYFNYLFLVGQIQSADRNKSEWLEITYYHKIRNLIAHNGGIMITDPSKKLETHECYNFLKKHKVIMLSSLGHIRIKDLTFIEEFRKLTSTLSDNLTKEISDSFQI